MIAHFEPWYGHPVALLMPSARLINTGLLKTGLASFAAALFAGGGYLLFQAVTNFTVRCEDGGHPECAFIEQTARELGRMQSLGAAGCALVAAGLLLYLRSLKEKTPTP